MGTDVRVRNSKLHCHSCYSNDEGKHFCSHCLDYNVTEMIFFSILFQRIKIQLRLKKKWIPISSKDVDSVPSED